MQTYPDSVTPPIIPEDQPPSNNFLTFYKKLTRSQKVSLIAFVFMIFAIPVSVVATLNEIRSRSNAAYSLSPAPATPPQPPTPPPSIPPPMENKPPYIQTTTLPSGKTYQTYRASVTATDPDAGNPNFTVTLTASGLPAGLTLDLCRVSYTAPASNMTCTILGRPTTVGKYLVTFKVVDHYGITVTKSLPLVIVKGSSTIIPIDPQPTPALE